MQGYFVVEIFPKLGSSFTPIKGDIEFVFQRRDCFLSVENDSIDLKISAGSKGLIIIRGYNPVRLFIKGDRSEASPFVLVEKICDTLSLATGNHIAYFSSRVNEYSHVGSWGFTKDTPSAVSNSLTYRDSNSSFLDISLLNKIIKKVDVSDLPP